MLPAIWILAAITIGGNLSGTACQNLHPSIFWWGRMLPFQIFLPHP